MEILFQQYELIKDRRQTLFNYCETLQHQHLIHDHLAFGGRSIRYLLVHSANVYVFWVALFPKLDNRKFFDSSDFSSMVQVRAAYDEVDRLVNVFLQRFSSSMNQQITGRIASRSMEVTVSALQIFTHVITHQYHHKGQILSMSRQLGYTPIDTDIIRFE